MDFLLLVTPTDVVLSIIVSLLAAFPCSIILKRLGFSGWWSLTCFVPIAAIMFLWYLAFCRWPSVETANASEI